MGRKCIDLTGQTIHRWNVIRRVESDKRGHVRWLCQCECGQYKKVRGSSLKNGDTKSCGCLRKDTMTTHNHRSNHKTSGVYRSWRSMIQRCTNINNSYYKDYGGRGIEVCETWLKFENFLEDMGEKPEGLSLDRIDNNGDYCPENCRWATLGEQARNKRSSRLIVLNGEAKCLIVWCQIYHLKYHTVYNRIYVYGWTPEEALEIIPRKKS